MLHSHSSPPELLRIPISPVVFHFISPEMPSLFQQPEIPQVFFRMIEAESQRPPNPEKLNNGRHVITILTGAEKLVRQHITSSAQAGIEGIINQLIKMMKNQEKTVDKTAKDLAKASEDSSSGKEPGVNSGRVLLKLKVFDTEKTESPELQKQVDPISKDKVEVTVKPQGEAKGEDKAKLPITVDFKKIDPEKAISAPSVNIKRGGEESRPEGQKPAGKEHVLVGAAKASEINQKHMPSPEPRAVPGFDKMLSRQEVPAVKPRIEEAPIVAVNEKERPQLPADKPREEAKAEKVNQPEPVDKPRDIPREVRHIEHPVRIEQQVRAEQQMHNKTIPRVENESIMPAWMGINMPGFAKEAIEEFEKRSASHKFGEEADHKLIDLLYMVLCAVICGAQTLPEVVNFIESREKWFKAILGLRPGLPSRRLIWSFIAGLDPQQFQRVVVKWLHYVRGASLAPMGKHAASYLTSVHIWETPLGLIFGQRDRSEEAVDLQAAPDLMDAVFMRGSLVMTYRVDPKANSARKIVERGGDYLVEIDAELDSSAVQARELIGNRNSASLKAFESYIEGQERLVASVLSDEARQIEQNWGARAKTLSKLIYEPFMLTGRAVIERMYVSSLSDPSEEMFSMLRVQRKAESKCEWLVQLSFSPVPYEELKERIRMNLALFEAFGMKILEEKLEAGGDMAAARKKAASDPEHLLKLFGR